MDPLVLQELLKQSGLNAVFVALFISLLVNSIVGVIVFYLNQKIEQRRDAKVERLKTDLEKELATYMAREIRDIENVQRDRWELKRQACLDALEAVDSYVSHWLADVEGTMPVRQAADTVKARRCYNQLVLTCQQPEVIDTFLRIMFLTPRSSMADVTDGLNTLRIAIRKELGFGQELRLSRERAWFVRLAGDTRPSTSD